MKALLGFGLAAVAAVTSVRAAHASDEGLAPVASIVGYSKDALLVEIGDNRGSTLHDLVGTKGKGAVRCFTADDKFHGGLIGCFVGIKRDGTLTAPTVKADDKDFWVLAPVVAEKCDLAADKAGVKVTVHGAVGAEIGLWTSGGPEGKKGTLTFAKQADLTIGGPPNRWKLDVSFLVQTGGFVHAS